ncbi:MAG TPA: NAD(P)-dependent alcohol dehydrogenase [Bryobacteraceae bacterium]|nr:NAD(P)-dependent alcohol dehydrogenase [Bryobacteraceae bacterium]
MKAAICNEYDSPDSIRIQDVEKPVPSDNEVLIQVRAASLNPADWHMKKGKPFAIRFIMGLRRPKDPRLGLDVAGRIERIGTNVTRFRPGDDVFGSCRSACAEYACGPESAFVKKPENITFEQAAAVPVAAYTALQGLRDNANVQPGQKVLINGAAGGVGTFAVQIAKWLGASVAGVCSTRNADLVRSIGADQVIDYTQVDFTRGTQRYDVLFDLVANHSLRARLRVLKPKGVYIGAGILGRASMIGMVWGLLLIPFFSWFVSQKVGMLLARKSERDLALMHDLLEAGTVRPVIDRCYRLSEIPDAIRRLDGKHARGKIIIVVDDSAKV